MNTKALRPACSLMLLLIVLVGAAPHVVRAYEDKSASALTKPPLTGLPQWQRDGVPVVTEWGDEIEPQIVTDGTGGAIVVWRDFKPYYTWNGSAHLYAQRISAAGEPLWQQNGIAVTSEGDARTVQTVSDGHGGAIVAWQDGRSGKTHVYAQRITGNGEVVWTGGGIQLSASDRSQDAVVAEGDGAGGVFVAWHDSSGEQGAVVRVYAQHLRADGSIGWPVGGVAVADAYWGQSFPQIAADGAAGAIVTWYGDCAAGRNRLCIQRLGPDGARMWGQDAVVISVASKLYAPPQLLGDGAGGAIIAWIDQRSLNDDIYAQRVGPDGKARWKSGGIPVTEAAGEQALGKMIGDGQGGAILAWEDRSPQGPNILLQRLGADGRPVWHAAGVALTSDGGSDCDLTPDGAGGAIIAWHGWGAVSALWLQRLDSVGTPLWSSAAKVVQDQHGLSTPRVLRTGKADVIVVWADDRRWYKYDEWDIYAQRVVEGSHKAYLPTAVR